MGLDLPLWLGAILIAAFAGFIKGAVGFALPLIMISGLSSIMSPELALAGLILPGCVTNIFQGFRQGIAAARQVVITYQAFLLTGLVFLLGSAGLVTIISDRAMMAVLGVPILAFALSSLFGRGLVLPPNPPAWVDILLGAIAGFFGGIAGVWGPTVVAWLAARNTAKVDAFRVQGVIFLLGSLSLLFAHLVSGVLNRETLVFSAVLVVPALLGMRLGQTLSDRFSQQTFRTATLIVLTIAAINLLRRAVMGA